MKNWPQYKANNLSDLDEFIMKTRLPEFGIEFICPQNSKFSKLQFAPKKPVFNKNKKIIYLMGAGIYNGPFGI